MTQSLPPKSHNNPPSDVEWLSERLALDHVTLIRYAEENIAIAAKIPHAFHADVEATFTTDYIKKLNECVKTLENTREEEKRPFLKQGQFVDSFFNDLKDKVKIAISKAQLPLTDYLTRKAKAEQEQREREAAQLRKEQEEALAQAIQVNAAPDVREELIKHAHTMADVAQVAEDSATAPLNSMAIANGKYSQGALHDVWIAEIVDVNVINLNTLRPHFTLPELEKVIYRYVKKGGRNLDGVKIYCRKEAKVK